MNTDKFRVYLRALEPEDYNTTIIWRKDDEILQKLTGRKYFVSKETEKKWIQDNLNNSNSIKLAGCLKENNKHIAIVYLNNVDLFNRNAVFEIMIGDKEYWNKGIGTEFALLLLYYAFINLGLERVESRILASHSDSINLFKKIGFIQEGLLRKAVYKDGSLKDIVVMSLLKDEFMQHTMKNLAMIQDQP